MIERRLLLSGYAGGYFPMADPETGEIGWYSPDPRGILELDQFVCSRSLRRTIRNHVFEIRIDTAFESVMRHCAERDETWISEEIIESYVELFRSGFAHSVESWKEGTLVGGLYGVALGGAFFGESMFSRQTDASKVALAALVDRLQDCGYVLLDTQYLTPHLESLGATAIPKSLYLRRLQKAVTMNCSFV